MYCQLETLPQKEKKYSTFLVTNKHVLQNLRIAILRFNPKTVQSANHFTESLIDGNGIPTLTRHPNPNVDVAVLAVNTQILNEQDLK